MRLIKSYDNKNEIQNFINQYQEKCEVNHIFLDKGIEKPSYDETADFMTKIQASFHVEKQGIVEDLQLWLPTWGSRLPQLAEVIAGILGEVQTKNIAVSILKNIYVRCFVALKYKFADVKLGSRVLYIGKPDKYEFIILSVLGGIGADVLIMDLNNSTEIEYLCTNKFEVVTGSLREPLDYTNVLRKQSGLQNSSNVINTWCNFNNCLNCQEYLDLINSELTTRKVENNWRTVHFEVVGVPDETNYGTLVNTVNQKAGALGRQYVIFDRNILNPTYEETAYLTANFDIKKVSPQEILRGYPLFDKSSIVVDMTAYINNLIEQKKFDTESKKENYLKVLYLWLIRYLQMFYKGKTEIKLPLAIVWGSLNQKEEEFIGLLSLLPIDIVHFAPSQADMYKVLLTDKIFRVQFGVDSSNFKTFPQPSVITTVATTAYKAEREVDALLYTCTEGLYRSKQFKEIEPLGLKTTYDEIDILWKEEAKFRPNFETVGNLVKVPTIFAKIDGVHRGDKDEYLRGIKRLITKDTLFFQNLPYVTEQGKDSELYAFVKQLVFHDTIDFNRLRMSKFYTFGVYSEETQSLIMRKVEQLIALNWCNNPSVKNLTYKVLEVVFSLPHNIVQMIHGYDFTANIPKLVVYSGGDGVCSLEDSILIMFLKLVGFDIVIFAPTGYRVVEQYINPNILNSINLGNFDFSLHNVDIMQIEDNKKKKGLFSIFG